MTEAAPKFPQGGGRGLGRDTSKEVGDHIVVFVLYCQG